MRRFVGFEKGVDLGGWLSQGSYDKEHLDNFIKEEDIKRIASWGADHVRLPADYNIFETEDGEPIEYGIAYVEKALEWCEKYDLNMVLDLHKTAGFSFHAGYGESGFFDSEEYQERFYKLWERLSKRFGKYPDRVAFELLNEVTDPAFSDTWNKIIRTVIGRIRKFAPTTRILVGGYWNNSVDALKDLDPPYDEYIVYNFHCYSPILFTHQGAYWIETMPADLRINYPGDITEYRKTIKDIKLDYMEDYLNVPEKGFDAEFYENKFKVAIDVCEERDAMLYCGEYGVIDRADTESMVKWYKDINTAFKKYNIGRAAWSYKAVDFGLLEREAEIPNISEIL